jgi:hypothetical protein
MRNNKSLHCAYLYADGHAVIIYKKQDNDAGEIQFAEIIESFGPKHCSFTGRIVISRYGGLLNLIRKAYTVRATAASTQHGSDRTRELGISVGYLEVEMSNDWNDSITLYDMPGTMAGPYTYQPETVETFDAGISRWSGYPVARIHRVKSPEPVQAAA